jgi:hypothetical protein
MRIIHKKYDFLKNSAKKNLETGLHCIHKAIYELLTINIWVGVPYHKREDDFQDSLL